MTDRPIIFAAPMIRALLAGRKTQTRRLLKPQPYGDAIHNGYEPASGPYFTDQNFESRPLPFWAGDRLWVREAWAPLDALTHNDPGTRALCDRGFYRADDSTVDGEISRWRPSIHMPRWASRLTLLVTDVKIERLQDISEADARAEGAMLHVPCKSAVAGTTIASDSWHYDRDLNGRLYEGRTAHDAFEVLWGKIHGWKSWDADPWVAAISFDVIRSNIDAPPESPPASVETQTEGGRT